YTGLPVDYILEADLRIDGGEFRQTLQSDGGMTTGRLDSRFSGPDIDPLSQRADYDPQSTALSSAYVSALNDYVRRELLYGDDRIFKPRIQTFRTWNFAHQQPGHSEPPLSARQGTNVMPDLANAMKLNPNLKVQLNAGYFDLATPSFMTNITCSTASISRVGSPLTATRSASIPARTRPRSSPRRRICASVAVAAVSAWSAVMPSRTIHSSSR